MHLLLQNLFQMARSKLMTRQCLA